jgi:hypothetical protein
LPDPGGSDEVKVIVVEVPHRVRQHARLIGSPLVAEFHGFGKGIVGIQTSCCRSTLSAQLSRGIVRNLRMSFNA